MIIKVLLPLGKNDPCLRAAKQLFDIANVGHDAALVESLKYDCLVFEEIQADPFLIMALPLRPLPRSVSAPPSLLRYRAAQ